jgi:hypothetical protein
MVYDAPSFCNALMVMSESNDLKDIFIPNVKAITMRKSGKSSVGKEIGYCNKANHYWYSQKGE